MNNSFIINTNNETKEIYFVVDKSSLQNISFNQSKESRDRYLIFTNNQGLKVKYLKSTSNPKFATVLLISDGFQTVKAWKNKVETLLTENQKNYINTLIKERKDYLEKELIKHM